jgi:hypothetical protein
MHLPIHIKEQGMNKTITDDRNQSREAVQDALLVRAAQQDPAQFDALYARWLKPIYRYFYFRLGQHQRRGGFDLTGFPADLSRPAALSQPGALFPPGCLRSRMPVWVDFYRKDSRKGCARDADREPGNPLRFNGSFPHRPFRRRRLNSYFQC